MGGRRGDRKGDRHRDLEENTWVMLIVENTCRVTLALDDAFVQVVNEKVRYHSMA